MTSEIGKTAEQVNDETPGERDVAEALGFEINECGSTELNLRGNVTKADLLDFVEAQQRQIDRLTEEVEQLKEGQEKDRDLRQQMARDATEATETAEQAKEIAVAASATAETTKANIRKHVERGDQIETDASEHRGPSTSSSPLDFFANCRDFRVKKHFLEENKKNPFRAIQVAKRWDEYATKRSDGSGIFWTRDDVEDALNAILGKRPHRETKARVWDQMKKLGGNDLLEKERRVSAKQRPISILTMDREAAERLLDCRYHHLDLLEPGGTKGQAGGVTPVVTKPESQGV